ncbi:MAG: site-specific DNA-methyltransferase, partial [Tissierellia bacterium]|nr:site-specific DNA-methyltransferase [Tissierellia bacterium]
MIGKNIEENVEIKVNSREIEKLKKEFPQYFDKDGEFLLNRFKEMLRQSDISLNKEGYELKFLGKSYARYLSSTKTETYLAPHTEENRKEENKDSENLYIIGDNLDALKHLLGSYAGKIKCIYIDPPYNTGSDGFVYPDNFSFDAKKLSEMIGIEEEEAERIINLKGKSSHSAWLTFMYPRLILARELLSDDGVIFISIDDNEQANLKLMCDEVFGEENFVFDLVRKTKSTTNDAKTGVNLQHENCLVYAKNNNQLNLLGGEKNLSRYTNPDNDPNGDWISDNPSAKSGNMKTGYFPIKNPYTGKVDYPPKGMFWRFSKNTIQKHIDYGTITFKKEHKENERGFIYKRYKKDLKTTKRTFDSLAFSDNDYMNQVGTKELLSLDLAEYFTYPKGVNFIKEMILHSTDKSSLVLDFFSGSATTADAVMQLNAEDGG